MGRGAIGGRSAHYDGIKTFLGHRSAGPTMGVVESIVGHTSPAMTRFYTHVGEPAAGVAAELLPEVTAG